MGSSTSVCTTAAHNAADVGWLGVGWWNGGVDVLLMN